MFGENFEDQVFPYSIQRLKLYRVNMPYKAYVDDGNLQICIQETEGPPPKQTENKAIFRMLFNHYHQKQQGEIAPQKKHLNKMEICQELTQIQDTFQEMMELKSILNSEYKSLLS